MTREIFFPVIVIFQLFSLIFCQVNTEWIRTHNGSANYFDGGSILTVDDSGNVYVAGSSSENNTGSDVVLLKYDCNGVLKWERLYNRSVNSGEGAKHMVIDRFGNIYLTGSSYISNTKEDIITLKYNSAGTLLWSNKYNGPANDEDWSFCMGIDNSCNVYVTGYSLVSGFNYDITTIKYDSSGTEKWVQIYDGPVHGTDMSMSLIVDSLGNVYITGDSEAQTLWDVVTIKYSTLGECIWIRRYGTPGRGEGGITINKDVKGYIYVGGYSGNGGVDRNFLVIKYSAEGEEIWASIYGAPGGMWDVARSLGIDNNGNVFATGECYTPFGTTYGTVKFDSLGLLQWARFYTEINYPWGVSNCLALDEIGNVYVTGENYDSNSVTDIATLKYSSEGEMLWVKRYNGTSNENDEGNYIFVDSDYNIYVVGSSTELNNETDIVTIKYSQLIGIEPVSNIIPQFFSLYQNYPNPFNPTTTIKFDLPKDALISLKIYDVLGRELETIFEGYSVAGTFQVSFDGSKYTSGLYFYRIHYEGFAETKKMILSK